MSPSPINNSVETLTDIFDPHRDLLGLGRCLSPTSSIRGCYVRSRPTSFLDDNAQTQGQLLNFSSLGDALNGVQGQDKDSESPPPYVARGHRRFDSFRSRYSSHQAGPRYEADTISVITTRTTLSTFRAVRNPEVTPPMLRQSEKGKKLSRSTGDLLSNANEVLYRSNLEALKKKKADSKDYRENMGRWKGGRRLKERFSLLFGGRKENAGILDQDTVGHKEAAPAQGRKKSFSFRRAAKVVEGTGAVAEVGGAKDSLELERTRSRKSSVFRRRGTKNGHGVKGNDTELQEMAKASGKRLVRHSRSFVGFRASATVDDIPPVPKVPDAMKEDVLDDEDIDEITKEATQVNKSVRRNYSYEEDYSDEE